MYCQNCGHQNPNNTNFCQNCGSRLNVVNVQQSVQISKTKKEYMKEYRINHPQMFIFAILSGVVECLGAIIILVKILEIISKGYLSSNDKKEVAIAIVVGLVLVIIGMLFMRACNNIEKQGQSEYENYYLVNYSNNNSRGATVSNNGWTCQKCGMNNPNNTSTCGNCGASRVKVVYRTVNNEPSQNEWKCPSCGRINQNYVGTCGCGERKP